MSIPEYTLIRSKRKTVALHVDDAATLVVKAPRLLPRIMIDAILKEKHSWIIDALEKRKEVLEQNILQEGRLYYQGMSIPLGKDHEDLEVWYKKEAKRLIPARVLGLAEQHQYMPERVRISSAKTRWGSCSSNNTINISWRLILAPKHILDYVILHELAHLKHMNHSKAFWNRVAESCPHFEDSKKWLKKHGHMLTVK